MSFRSWCMYSLFRNKGSNETADKKEESENPATVKEKVEEPEKQSEPVLMQPEEEPMEEPEVDEVQEKEEQETEKQIKEDPEHQVEELLDSLSVEKSGSAVCGASRTAGWKC